MKHRSGFTLTEVLVAIVLLGMICGLLISMVTPAVDSAKKMAARDAARSVQTALGTWIANAPSLAAARTQWGSANTPPDHSTFFSSYLAPYLNPESAAQFTASGMSDATQLRNAPMADIGASITLYWDGDYRHLQPQAQLLLP